MGACHLVMTCWKYKRRDWNFLYGRFNFLPNLSRFLKIVLVLDFVARNQLIEYITRWR